MNKELAPWIIGGLSLAAVGALVIAARKDQEDGGKGAGRAQIQSMGELERISEEQAALEAMPLFQIEAGTDLQTGFQTLDPSTLAQGFITTSAGAIIRAINAKDKRVFKTKYAAKDLIFDKALRGLPESEKGRYNIFINTYDELHYFGSLMAICWMLEAQDDPMGNKIGAFVLNWFYYQRWEISANLRALMVDQLVAWSCVQDPRLPSHQHGAYGAYERPRPDNPLAVWEKIPGQDQAVWPGYNAGPNPSTHPIDHRCYLQQDYSEEDQRYWAEWALTVTTIKAGKSTFFGSTTQSGATGIGPPGALVEYAIARYMQFGFVSLMDPKSAEAVGANLMAGVKGALEVAAAGVGMFAAATSAIPVVQIVGWVAAAVYAVYQVFMAIWDLASAIGKTREARGAVAVQIEGFLASAWERFGYYYPPMIDYLSGYRADLLIPQGTWRDIALYDDLTEPLWPEYCLVSSRDASAVPQLPFFYLGIDFPFPASVTQPGGKWLCIVPTIKAGRTIAWTLKEYSFAEYNGAVAAFYKNNPLMRKK